MDATADDSYDTCPRCKWVGKLRKDGTMRKHRESVDMGHFTMSGGLPQQRYGDTCKGSGEKPWEPGLPEGYELPKQNEHGGWERGDEADREQVRREARPRYIVAQLGTGYFAVLDNVTDLHVATTTSRKRAHDRAAELNAATEKPKQDPEPSLDDYAKASRIIQSLIPRGRR